MPEDDEKWQKETFFEKTSRKICWNRKNVLPLHPQMRNHYAVWRDSSAG